MGIFHVYKKKKLITEKVPPSPFSAIFLTNFSPQFFPFKRLVKESKRFECIERIFKYLISKFSISKYSMSKYSMSKYLMSKYLMSKYSMSKYLILKYSISKFSISKFSISKFIFSKYSKHPKKVAQYQRRLEFERPSRSF